MRAIHLTGCFVFVAFLVGTYVGTTATEHRIASGCLAGERIRIGDIEVKCPSMPVWGEP